MPLPSLATGTEVAELVGRQGDAAFVSRCAEAAEVVSALVRSYTRQVITLVSDDTDKLEGTPRRRLLLGERPVISVGTVILDGHEITDHAVRRAALWRDTGWGGTDSEVMVTYTHGYAAVPDDLWAVCRTASLRFAGNPEGVVRWEASGEYSEMPAPAGFTIAEQLALNRYRRRSLP